MPTDHAADADLRWCSHYSNTRLIPHPSLLWCVFTVLCRKLQNYSEFFLTVLSLCTHLQLEAPLFHPASQSAHFFIRFASLLNLSSLLFLCDISLCLH